MVREPFDPLRVEVLDRLADASVERDRRCWAERVEDDTADLVVPEPEPVLDLAQQAAPDQQPGRVGDRLARQLGRRLERVEVGAVPADGGHVEDGAGLGVQRVEPGEHELADAARERQRIHVVRRSTVDAAVGQAVGIACGHRLGESPQGLDHEQRVAPGLPLEPGRDGRVGPCRRPRVAHQLGDRERRRAARARPGPARATAVDVADRVQIDGAGPRASSPR